MAELHVTGTSQYEGVVTRDNTSISYSTWAALIRDNFDQRFWYPEGGFYKDTVGGGTGGDIQLRPNQVGINYVTIV